MEVRETGRSLEGSVENFVSSLEDSKTSFKARQK